MATEILMPALSPTMEEGTLAKWLVKEGDTITSGMVMAEIETDKATMEFEAVDEGVMGKILIPAGTQGVKVNTPIALLVEEGAVGARQFSGWSVSYADPASFVGRMTFRAIAGAALGARQDINRLVRLMLETGGRNDNELEAALQPADLQAHTSA